MDNTISKTFAEYIASTKFEDLPDDAVITAKKSIMDTLGIMFPATTLSPASDIVHNLYTQFDRGGNCTLIGYGRRASLFNAIMINGSLTHAVDFDDDSGPDKPLTHPTAACFPAAFALGEQDGSASGKQLITAIAVAEDVVLRIADCVKGNILWDYEFFPPMVLGVFLSTIASCKMLGLSADRTLDAMGLAINRVSGVRDALMTCEFRSIRDAFGNKEGASCALLASKGFSGCPDPIEQLYRVFYDNNVDTTHLLDNLGKDFYNAKYVGYKPWPSCHGTHPYLQAVLENMDENSIDADSIERIDLVGCDQGENLFSPKEEKAHPHTVITAKIALPYVAAVAACRGAVTLADFDASRLDEGDVSKMTEKIFFTVNNELPPNSAIAKITLTNGAIFEKRVDVLRGSVYNPMSLGELREKFTANAAMAKKPFKDGRIELLGEKLLDLENIRLHEISSLLV